MFEFEDYWLSKYLLTAEGDSLLSMAGGGEGDPPPEGDPPKPSEGDPPADDVVDIKVPKADLEGIPDNFLKDGQFSPGSLVKSWKDQQNQIKDLNAKVKPAVEDPKEYKLTIPEDDKDLTANAAKVLKTDEKLGEDPIVHDFRSIAHKHNLSQEAFEGILQWYVNRQGPLMEPPIDQKAELEKLGPDGQKAIDYVDSVRETLKANGTLDDDMYNEMWLTCSSAAGIKLVKALLQQGGGMKLPTDLTPEDKAVSAEKLKQKVRELMEKRDKGEITAAAADREYAAIQEQYKDIVGSEQGGSSLVMTER